MYNLDELLGEVVTIKFNNGIEIVALLGHINEDDNIVTLANPRVVVINGDQGLALIPYAFTADTSSVFVPMTSIQAMLKTVNESVEDYNDVVAGK